MSAVSKIVYFDVSDNIINEYNNTYNRAIVIKPIYSNFGYYDEYRTGFNAKDANFKINQRVRISKYKNIFTKGYAHNWSEEVSVISKVKNIVPWLNLVFLTWVHYYRYNGWY